MRRTVRVTVRRFCSFLCTPALFAQLHTHTKCVCRPPTPSWKTLRSFCTLAGLHQIASCGTSCSCPIVSHICTAAA
jgi:hypothetical protein